MKSNNKAFTLIELLAVIIILAIVALIATPIILDVIEDSRDSANLSEVNLILGGAETYYAQSFLTGDSKQFDGVTNLYSNIKTTNEKPPLGNLTIRSDGKTSLSIYNEGVCYTKGYDDSKVQVDKTITSLDDCVPLSIVAYTNKSDNNNWYKENLTVTIETNGERFEYCLKDETDVCTNIEVTETTTTVDLTQGFNEICATGYRGENTSNTCVEFNIDTTVPTLTAKTNNFIGAGAAINTSSFYEEPVYGISGGSVSCNPSNTNNITTQTTVTCSATSNAGLSSGNIETTIAIADTPAPPELTEALIAVNIAPNGAVTKANTTDGTWYAYHNKEWANAVIITDDENRLIYQNASPGTVINQTHISSYYVWIPRYEYQLFDLDIDSDAGEEQSINIDFVTKDDPKKTTVELGQYYTHPGFTIFDGTTTIEINGFWAAKFSISGSNQSLPAGYPTTSGVTMEETFNAGLNIATQFNLNTGSKTVESHAMKNSEWGAVTYLTYSQYGIDKAMSTFNYIKTGGSYRTGCNGFYNNNTCNDYYGTKNNNDYPHATTGNITGIFDMSGGFSERIMGNFGNRLNYMSFTPNIKYYDIYLDSTSVTERLGHALTEIRNWYDGGYNESGYPWVARSGNYPTNLYTDSGHYGYGGKYQSFRTVLWVY